MIGSDLSFNQSLFLSLSASHQLLAVFFNATEWWRPWQLASREQGQIWLERPLDYARFRSGKESLISWSWCLSHSEWMRCIVVSHFLLSVSLRGFCLFAHISFAHLMSLEWPLFSVFLHLMLAWRDDGRRPPLPTFCQPLAASTGPPCGRFTRTARKASPASARPTRTPPSWSSTRPTR